MPEQKLSILIADDNELNCWLLTEQLERWPVNITIANDGLAAWKLLQTRKYSLLFLDLNMPKLSGLELIKKIRAEPLPNQFTPAIAVSADNRQHPVMRASGFTDCLCKPIFLEHLEKIFEQLEIFSSNESATFYARQLTNKSQSNRELSHKFLNRIFEEVPEYLRSINLQLERQDYQQAWDIAHKLQGTFGFFGFADFLPMAENLAESLLEKQSQAANTQLQALEVHFARMLDNRAVLFEMLELHC